MIYCFDLDNTLCNTKGNYYEEATPKEERIAFVNKLYREGHTIIIDTARGCVSGKNWFYFTLEQLKGWDVKFHTLRTGVKFGADIFVDDKGFNDKDFFNGNSKKVS
jgi:hypothetical protein